jgi:hypothetical protein
MIINKPTEKIAVVIAFLLPLVLVKGGAMVTGSGPAEAQATPGNAVEPPKIPGPPLPRAWSVEERAAADRVAFLRTQPFGRSPLAHVAVVPVKDDPPPPKRVEKIEPPKAIVRAILTRSDGNHIALIDRKRFRVGDPIGDKGWFIVEINGPDRAVSIEHQPSGETATLNVPLPR